MNGIVNQYKKYYKRDGPKVGCFAVTISFWQPQVRNTCVLHLWLQYACVFSFHLFESGMKTGL